jgi:hypothetical protein
LATVAKSLSLGYGWRANEPPGRTRTVSDKGAEPHWTDRLSKVTAAIQSIAVTVGLIVAAWWAAATFGFLNPRFQEQGLEAYGWEARAVNGHFSVERLSTPGLVYEAILTLENKHNVLDQQLSFDRSTLLLRKMGEKDVIKLLPTSTADKPGNIRIPVGETRDLHFLVEFPREGIFLLEFNPCAIGNSGCPIQKYVNVKA